MGTTERYEEKQESIAKAAFKLFRSNGYENTSVKDIADAAGIKKALVRYYFPKKEAFEDLFLTRSLNKATMDILKLNIPDLSFLGRLYLMGYEELYYVTQHESMLKLGVDIMASRDVTRFVSRTMGGWIRTQNEIPPERMPIILEGITYAMGAAFEVVYQNLVLKRSIDIDDIFEKAMRIMNVVIEEEVVVPEAKTLLTEEWLQKKAKEMDKVMFGF